MLNINFQDHRTSSSGEEYLKVFTIYWRRGHLAHVTMKTFERYMFRLLMEAPNEIML